MRKLSYLLLLIAHILFVACSEEIDSSVQIGGDESVTPSITLGQTSINFNEGADTQEITFNSAMAWTAELINERADGWCSINPTSGSAGSGRINVTVTENSTPDDRTASVIIKSGTISRTVRISQKQQDALTVTASSFEVEGTKGKIYIEVKANIDFEYTINGSAAEWITPIETRAMKTTTLGFNIDQNNSMETREGTITIHSGDLEETVTVYQKCSEYSLIISKDEFVVSDEYEDIAVEVTSNVDVEIVMPDVDWITRNTSRAVSTNTYYFTIAENTTPNQREAYITFKNTEKKITERVNITQVQRGAIIIAKSHYEINKDGEELKIDIRTNANVNVTISENATSWIKQVQSRTLPTKTLLFDISSNNDTDYRSGRITFSSETTTQSITITQKGIELGTPNNNEIYYITSNKEPITPDMTYWLNETIISNIYDQEKGYGIITFETDIKEIGNYAFGGCLTLTSITIPDSVTSIGNYAFNGCKALTSINIPGNVKTISHGTFWNCSNLTEITLNEGLETIESCAFYYCNIKSVTIPQSVVEIGGNPFSGCNNIEAFYGKFASEDNSTLIKDGEIIAIANHGKITLYTIPNGITKIAAYAFMSWYNLQSVTIPNSVTEIGTAAFASCRNLASFSGKFASADGRCIIIDDTIMAFAPAGLTEYSMPNGVTKIGENAFAWLSGTTITSITIHNSVTEIGANAFWDCRDLKEITIPENVKTISYAAFGSCDNLSKVYVKATTPPTINNQVFSGNADGRKIYVPRASVNAYKSADGWNEYAEDIVGYDF